jgi:hypothetical protein
MRPAALMRGPRRKATSKPVSSFAAGSSWAAAKSARRPAPAGRQCFFAGAYGIATLQQSLRKFKSNRSAAQKFFRVRTALLVGIEDGKSIGHAIAGLGQVVVGDDKVEAKMARGFRFRKGAHTRVNGDY